MPTDDVCVSETPAGIRREAAKKGQVPRKKVAATATILRRLLAPIGSDVRGLRDRAILLVGFAGGLRRSELAAIRFEHLEKTDRGIRLTLPQTKGEQTDAVTVPLPYDDTELCPVHALELWQQAAGPTEGPVFRRIWLPPRPTATAMGEPPPLPRIGTQAISPQTAQGNRIWNLLDIEPALARGGDGGFYHGSSKIRPVRTPWSSLPPVGTAWTTREAGMPVGMISMSF